MNTAAALQSDSHQHDLGDDIKYINGLLGGFGLEEFPFHAVFADAGSGFVALQFQARVCSILIQLLHSKQKEEVFRKDSEDRIVRLMDEIRSMEAAHRRQEDRIRLQDRELTGQRQQQQLLAEKQRQVETGAATQRDELTKLKQTCVQKERQFQHELRKREREFERLKDQLAAVLKDVPLREQKSDIQYMQSSAAGEQARSEAEGSDLLATRDDSLMIPEEESRVTTIETENFRLRQIVSHNFCSLVQLVTDLFPDVVLDESILSLIETNPVEWIEEPLALKLEELVTLLKDNLASLALERNASASKEHDELVSQLRVQHETASATIAAQAESIRLLEMKLAKMEDYRRQVESLEIERARLLKGNFDELAGQDRTQPEGTTPKWMRVRNAME